MWGQQGHAELSLSATITERPAKKRKILETTEKEASTIPDYFPASCEHMFGPLPIPTRSKQTHIFPHNVVFQTADWVNTVISEDKIGYDVVIA